MGKVEVCMMMARLFCMRTVCLSAKPAFASEVSGLALFGI